jgi:hypothetical protein
MGAIHSAVSRISSSWEYAGNRFEAACQSFFAWLPVGRLDARDCETFFDSLRLGA